MNQSTYLPCIFLFAYTSLSLKCYYNVIVNMTMLLILGLCYKESSRCDNYFDCPDGIDEFLCKQEPDVRCKVGEIKCGLSKICRPWNSRCNGVNDCPGGEDEFDCPLALNPPTITQCDCGQLFCDGICKPAYRICDNVADCRDNRDESNCRIPPPRVRQVIS